MGFGVAGCDMTFGGVATDARLPVRFQEGPLSEGPLEQPAMVSAARAAAAVGRTDVNETWKRMNSNSERIGRDCARMVKKR